MLWSASLVVSNTLAIGLVVKSVEEIEVSLEASEETAMAGWVGPDLTDSNGEIVRGYLDCLNPQILILSLHSHLRRQKQCSVVGMRFQHSHQDNQPSATIPGGAEERRGEREVTQTAGITAWCWGAGWVAGLHYNIILYLHIQIMS